MGSGFWLQNLVYLTIGGFYMEIWSLFSTLFGIFGLWLLPLQGYLGVVNDYAPKFVNKAMAK